MLLQHLELERSDLASEGTMQSSSQPLLELLDEHRRVFIVACLLCHFHKLCVVLWDRHFLLLDFEYFPLGCVDMVSFHHCLAIGVQDVQERRWVRHTRHRHSCSICG